MLNGYKHTELGIIPQEWHIKTLGAICDNICSGNNKNKSLSGNYPVYGSTGIIGYTSEFVYNKPTILVARVGANAGLINKVDGCFDVSDNTLIIDCKRDVNFNFLYELLQFTNFNKFVFGSGQPLITAGLLKSIRIPVPPVEEQRKIAEILGVWDKAIELQARLVDKLELRKRALMQRLLTGRLRLPGFSDPWQKVKLCESGSFLSTNTLSRDKLNNNNGIFQNIHYGDILVRYQAIVNPDTAKIPYINDTVTISSDLLRDGDIVFADTAEDNLVGKAIEIVNVNSRKIVSGLHTIAFRPNIGLFAVPFLGYYINSAEYQRQIEPLIQGIKVCSICKTAIKETYLRIPSFAEQTAIAEVLSTADKEIEIAKAKLAAYRTQKRGLMQQLLTGKKRVKL